MWLARDHAEKKGDGGIVAVAIDKDKGSQYALKWAIDNLLQRGQTVYLVHVKLRTGSPLPTARKELEPPGKDLFLPFRCFCTRKDIQCRDVILEDNDVARALIEYVNHNIIENLVVGVGAKSSFLRFKATDIPGTLAKGAPDFCSVFVISKGKVVTSHTASRSAPAVSPLQDPSPNNSTSRATTMTGSHMSPADTLTKGPTESHYRFESDTEFRSPFTRGKGTNGKAYGECTLPDSDISFVSTGRPNVERILPLLHDSIDHGHARLSSSSDLDGIYNFEQVQRGRRSVDIISHNEFSYASQDSDHSHSSSSPHMGQDDLEAEMRRLRLELKQTMEMYSTACKEALSAKQKAKELQRWKIDEQRRLEEARLAEEAALAIAEKERAKSRAAIEHAEAGSYTSGSQGVAA